MKVNSKKYQTSDKKQILDGLRSWLNEQGETYFFTTCYKARAVGVFAQYEIPDRSTDPYLYAADQGVEDVLNYVSQWLNAIFQKDVVFRVEEREKVGVSIFITLDKKEEIQEGDIEVSEDDVELEQPQPVKEDPVKKESEKRSMEEIVVTGTSKSISRSMDDELPEETTEGIKRSNLPSPKVKSNVRSSDIDRKISKQKTKKQVGRKAEYNWDKLPGLFKKHKGSVTKIAKELGCSGPAVRRQIAKLKLKDGT